ncbi:MAG: glycosyltransferase family 2 protein [Clostridium sp.]|nr:glycosyltransferase family 2 protein [Clostridium sp.]
MDKIAIILLNYNNEDDTLECVDSIKKNCRLDYEIIVVDNASNEESKKILLESKDEYTLILNKNNGGFAAGNNVGIKYALEKQYKYILLLNNDTLITKDSIEIMLESLKKDKQVGIVSCRILHYPDKNKVWYDGGKINWNKYLPNHINKGRRVQECTYINSEDYTEFISGCCMFVKSEIFQNVGYLPEEYFMYFEDMDFCVQITEHNYKMKVCKNSVIYHKVSSSSGGEESPFSIKWGNRNRLIIMKKFKYKVSTLNHLKVMILFYFTRIIKLVQYLITNNLCNFKNLLKGVSNAIKYNKNRSY